MLLGVAGVLLVGSLALLTWTASSPGSDGSGGTDEIPAGEQVQPFALPDVAAGQGFSLSGPLGVQEIVIVSYMGFF